MKALLHFLKKIAEMVTGIFRLRRRAKKHILTFQDNLDAHRMISEGGICPHES